MELDFDKYCVLDGSPTTVLPAPRRRSKAAHRKPNEKLRCEKNDIFTLRENFAEISLSRYRSASCRDSQAKRVSHKLPKLGSVYQSSKEVNLRSKKSEPLFDRKKIEFSRESASVGLGFGIIDSLCSSDEDRKRPMEESTSSHVCKNPILERNRASNLEKSLSAKLVLPQSPARIETGSFFKQRFQKSLLYRHKETICKPLVNNFSGSHMVSLNSASHLHGILNSESKNGVPFFEFSLKSPDDVYYVAKRWKLDNDLTWTYTFHSLERNKRKSNASGWGFKGSTRESTMVGQMAVSCYLCTNSMVAEYVLYDIAQSRRSTASRDSSSCEITETPLVSGCDHNEVSVQTMNKGRMCKCKHSRPLAAMELGPELETAAVIMRVPFEKGICDNSSRGEMHVVVPSGNHGLPSGERRGPSPLLDRWRLGGGCDCGGWDMGCPLDVFVNLDFRVAEGKCHPVKLFVEGMESGGVPAFSMREIGDGKYAVDFHVRLTSLQAFSLCVSVLHAPESNGCNI